MRFKFSNFSLLVVLIVAGYFILLCSWAYKQNYNKKPVRKGESRYNFDTPPEVEKALFHGNGLFRDFNPNSEIKEKRGRDSKHFKNHNGSITAIIGAGSLHYWEDGVWKEILSHILPNKTKEFTDRDYAAIYNEHKMYFPKNPGKTIITKIKEEVYEDWGQPTMVWLDSNANILAQVAFNPLSIGVPNKDSLTFTNIFPLTDAVMLNSITSKKLNYIIRDSSIIVNRPAGSVFLAFRESIKTSNSWKLTGTNSIESGFNSIKSGQLLTNIMFIDESGDSVIEIKQPMYYEQHPVFIPYEPDSTSHCEGSFLIKKINNGFDSYTLVPVKWLTNIHRDFPLVIDPTTNYYPGGTWPTYTAYRSGNSGSWFCATGSYGGRTYPNSDISYGWIDDTWPTNNPYLDGYATFNISSLGDASCISSLTYWWNRYSGRGCATDITLKFGMAQFNANLAEEPSCDITGQRSRNNNSYFNGTGKNGTGWQSQAGNVADLVAALPGNQITLGWAYNGGDDCCTCCTWYGCCCSGDDGNYHNVYGYESPTFKPYVTVVYESGPPAGYDKAWTGASSTDWTTAGNWCPSGKPVATDRVYIPGTTNKPTLITSESVSCVTIDSDGGAIVTIGAGGILNVGSGSCP